MPGVSVSEARAGIRAGRRLVGVDAARCLALVGMIATHVLSERTPSGDLTTAQWLAGGRASALFAVLAGVSVALVSGRGTPTSGTARTRVSAALALRAVVVGAIGLLLGTLGTGIAVILCYYAVLFVLALPFLGLRARPLLWLAVGWAVAAPVVAYWVRPELPPRQFASPAPDQLADPGRLLAELLLTGYYPAVPWLAYLLLGLGLGRLDLLRPRVAAVVGGVGLAVAVATTWLSGVLTAGRFTPVELDGAAGGMYGQTPLDEPRWLLVVAPHSTTPFDLLQTGGSACAVIGACLLVVHATGRVRGGERAVAVLFGAGTATLTLYCLHLLLLTEVRPGDDGSPFVVHVLVVLWAGAALVALGRRGPLEAGLAALTTRVRGRSR